MATGDLIKIISIIREYEQHSSHSVSIIKRLFSIINFFDGTFILSRWVFLSNYYNFGQTKLRAVRIDVGKSST